jgi:hypothetical protein
MNLPFAMLAETMPIIAQFGWKPFLTTMPVWDYWALLALPLCLIVAIVYKTTKCGKPSEILKESLQLFVWIVLGLVGAAACVLAIVAVN